jgi:hypothetical protein
VIILIWACGGQRMIFKGDRLLASGCLRSARHLVAMAEKKPVDNSVDEVREDRMFLDSQDNVNV